MRQRAEYPLLAARTLENVLRSKTGNSLQRNSLFRHLFTELVEKERLTLSLRKAKDLSRVTQRAIDVAKEGNRDLIYYWLKNKNLTSRVFDVLVPRYSDQKDGYTKVYNILPNPSHKGKRGIVELVGNPLPPLLKSEEELTQLQIDFWKREEKLEIPKEGTLV